MAPGTVTQMTDRPTVTRDLQASAVLPILELALFVILKGAQQPEHAREGLAVLLEGWSRVAGTVLEEARKEDAPGAQFARKMAARTIRIVQGYESHARDKGYQCLVEYVEGRHGVDRDLTDEELVALNNGMLHAFAGYAAYLDHTAGAVAGGGR